MMLSANTNAMTANITSHCTIDYFEASDFSENKYTTDWLKEVLKPVEGIIAVNMKNDIFNIESSRDSSVEIAKAIVESGAGLNYLNKKEYGLDDIYYRYFEGGDSHE